MSVSLFARTSQVRQNEKRTICLARFDLLRPPDTHTHIHSLFWIFARVEALSMVLFMRGGALDWIVSIYIRAGNAEENNEMGSRRVIFLSRDRGIVYRNCFVRFLRLKV